jgi:O-antigen ligase
MVTLGIITSLVFAALAIPVVWVIAATWLLKSWRAFDSSWNSDSRVTREFSVLAAKAPPESRGGVILALPLMHTPVLVLLYGLAGSGGNSVITASTSVIGLGLLAVIGWRRMSFALIDAIFVALVLAMLAALYLHPSTASRNEMIALALSLISYPAARCMTVKQINVYSIRYGIVFVAGLVVLVGTPLLLLELVRQWDSVRGHVAVFGLDAAPTLFAQCLGFLLIAASTSKLNSQTTRWVCSALLIPTAIYAACMIRLTFVAMFAAILLAAVLSDRRCRVLAIALTLVLAIGCGLAARAQMSMTFARFVLEETAERTAEGRAPSCGLAINDNNSIAIRKALFKDVVAMIPSAGLFGQGLDSFENFSCIKTFPHNVFLQSLAETGFFGGGLLIVLVITCFAGLVPIARQDRNAALMLCCLAYIIIIMAASGQLSGSGELFLLLGATAGMIQSCKRVH